MSGWELRCVRAHCDAQRVHLGISAIRQVLLTCTFNCTINSASSHAMNSRKGADLVDAVSYSVFRRNLKHYLQVVNDTSTPLLITSRDNAADTAVLMNKRDFDAMQETMRILSNPELMAKIRRGQAQIAAGKPANMI